MANDGKTVVPNPPEQVGLSEDHDPSKDIGANVAIDTMNHNKHVSKILLEHQEETAAEREANRHSSDKDSLERY